MNISIQSMARILGMAVWWMVWSYGLTACYSDDSDLQAWMNEQKSAVRPTITPIPEPKRFVPQPYDTGSALEPFAVARLTQALKLYNKLSGQSDALLSPELSRRKEALEAFPLDLMVMTGSIDNGKPIALVRVDKLLYQVRVGNYIGQNFGKVTKITETNLTLREIVQDPTGEWVERKTQLELLERSK